MISEPELGGGDEAPSAPLRPLLPEPSRPHHPWLWALGGAAVASALWAWGLSAYQANGPDLGGYRADRDPCRVARLDGLTVALGPRTGQAGVPLRSDHPALFEWDCGVAFGTRGVGYRAAIGYVLHRATDPGPEFTARAADPQLEGGGDPVDGLGDMAYFGGRGGENILTVLDGQAVLTLSVQPRYGMSVDPRTGDTGPPQEPPRLDQAALRTYLVEDMRQLMDALRR